MLDLLVLRERLRAFYAKYELFITPFLKFTVTFAAFLFINSHAGYIEKFKSPLIYIAASIVCCILPYGVISVLLAGYMVFNIFNVSMDMALIMTVFIMCMGFLYYGFKPGDSFLLIVTPLAFVLRVPYMVPILVGLGGGIISIVPVSFGILVYYMLVFVKNNIGSIANLSNVDILKKYTMLFNGLFADKTMFLMMIAFAVCIIIVYIIKNLSITYAWGVAIVCGIIAQLLVVFMGDFVYGIVVPLTALLGGMAISAVCAAVYNFFIFAVDYSHIEYTQFEDDEYYYYVKAVPKIVVARPDAKVQKFSAGKADRKIRAWLPDKKAAKEEIKKTDEEKNL